MIMKAGYSEDGQLNVAVVGLGWWGKAIIETMKGSAKIRAAKIGRASCRERVSDTV